MAVVAGMSLFGASMAQAKWHNVAELSADGKDAQEVNLQGEEISQIRIACTEGSIVINDVVVRTGGDGKDAHTVGDRIEAGNAKTIDIGDKVKATGLRISQDGHGKYKVEVK
jgi:hypothetical protein